MNMMKNRILDPGLWTRARSGGVIPRASGPEFRRQHGFVLLTALVMLLVLTLAAIVAMALQTTQIRVAANAASAQMALAAAEGVLMSNQSAVLQLQYPVTPVQCVAAISWSTTTCGATAWPTTATATVPGVAIEQLPAVTRPGESAAAGTYPGNRAPIYRITVRAANPSNQNSQAMVQSLIQ